MDTWFYSYKIKNDIYIGPTSCFASGVFIESENLIGLGSVITKSFLENKTIFAGNPATVLKQDVNWRINW